MGQVCVIHQLLIWGQKLPSLSQHHKCPRPLLCSSIQALTGSVPCKCCWIGYNLVSNEYRTGTGPIGDQTLVADQGPVAILWDRVGPGPWESI